MLKKEQPDWTRYRRFYADPVECVDFDAFKILKRNFFKYVETRY